MAQTSILLIRALAAEVDRAGYEPARFLAEAGLTESQLSDVYTRVDVDDYRRAVRAALRLTADPALGLHLAERISFSSFDVLGHLAEHNSCLRDAIQAAASNSRMITDRGHMALEELDDTALVRMTIEDVHVEESRLGMELSTLATLRLMRLFVGEEAQPRAVYFEYEAPAHRADYTRAFGGREHFSQPFTGIQIERTWLDRVRSYRSSELRPYLQARADFFLARVDARLGTAERIRRWLSLSSGNSRPTISDVAQGLGMSARTLRRRMREEGVQLAALVEEVMAESATRMLADSQHSIQETAYAFGFTTPSAFSRAYKRWTGQAPSAVKRAR